MDMDNAFMFMLAVGLVIILMILLIRKCPIGSNCCATWSNSTVQERDRHDAMQTNGNQSQNPTDSKQEARASALITKVMADLFLLETRIDSIPGGLEERLYYELDDLLTNLVLELDQIDICVEMTVYSDIRMARRMCSNYIQQCSQKLNCKRRPRAATQENSTTVTMSENELAAAQVESSNIMKRVSANLEILQCKVDYASGGLNSDRTYKGLDESLTQLLIMLDNMEITLDSSDKSDDIRVTRKLLVESIQETTQKLDAKYPHTPRDFEGSSQV